jgi:hypothetical protein
MAQIHRLKPLRSLLGIALAAFALTSCFHKSVMKDNADDIKGNFLYQGPEGNAIISWEEIFQATSKESNGGVTHISGYTEMRLSSYDVASGELKGRVKLGEMIEEGCQLLGWSPGKIWLFSIDEELGLHCRHPLTLEVIEAWPAISQKPGLGSLNLAKPEWTNISTYFAFDWELGKIVLTDMEGYHHLLDPNTYAIEKTEREMPDLDFDKDAFENGGEFQKDDPYYLEGEIRKEISFHGKKSGSSVSFLNGEFILDFNPKTQAARVAEMRKSIQDRVTLLQDSLKRYEAAHPEATSEPDWSKWTFEQRRIHDVANDIRRELDDAKRDATHFSTFDDEGLRYPMLSGDGHSAYVRYGSSLSDTALAMVAGVKFNPDTSWTILWSTQLPSLYFDANKADNAGAFETVFSKGDPSFDYTWAGTDGKHLVIIGQLRMVCIEMATGKVLWDKGL